MQHELTEDEAAVLMIAHEGGSVAPIGRWKPAVENLIGRGLLKADDRFNSSITQEGRAALDARAIEDDAALRRLIPQIAQAQTVAQSHVEAAAQHLVRATRASEDVTGDSLQTAILRWNIQVIKRAQEIVRG